MHTATIMDIYAGMPDAKDEINTELPDRFFESFIVPPGLPTEKLLTGRKFLVSGYKGVGKTSVLYYLQNKAQEIDKNACTSFMYFKSDYEEIKKSQMDAVAKKLTALVDTSGEIQPQKVEYLHIWKWVIFKKIVDDSGEYSEGLFDPDSNWDKFVKLVNSISFTGKDKHIISLSSLAITACASPTEGARIEAHAELEINKNKENFEKFANTVDECETVFRKLSRTDVPYYLFVDELEAFYGDQDLFHRDLSLIRDLIFIIHRLNETKKIIIIAAIRSEIINAMDRYITTNEINKIIDGYSAPIKWSYSNTTSMDHPIIQVLMKRISMATGGKKQDFFEWFPVRVHGKDTINYILDNGWNKPRDIVRLIIAAQNDNLHCNDNMFSGATFDGLMKEYSRNSLTEVRQELQSLYSAKELETILRTLRGGPRCMTLHTIIKRTGKGSEARRLWESRGESIIEDFYRVGIFGNINRTTAPDEYRWRWNHKDDTGVLTDNGWELVVHNALCTELTISHSLQ